MSSFLSRIALVALLFPSVTLAAQKPGTDHNLTIGQPAEKTFFLRGNQRIESATDRPIVVYQGDVWVNPGEPEVMAKEYLNRQKAMLGLTDANVENLDKYFVREGQLGTTVRFNQLWQGVQVFGGEVSMTILKDGKVVMVNNSFEKGIELADVTPTLTVASARQAAFDYVQPTGQVRGEQQKLLILPTDNGPKLVHFITFVSMEPLGEWQVFVDAETGDLLRVTDAAAYHKHNRKPAYAPFPMLVEGTGNVFEPDPLSSAGATYGDPGFSDNNDNTTPQLIGEQVSVALLDITMEGGMFFLKGPYCEITDEENPFRGDFSQATSDWDFNRDDNAFEAVNVYYHIDASMRYLNETLGVTVMPSLYTTGVRCDPSGLNGSDNSWYIGGEQRLAWGDGGVDDAEDSDVIHHELGHGLHDWITGGGLSQNQGLSEGSGDYWAASYNRSLGDWTSADPQYFWIFNWDGHNAFWNGRSCNDSRNWSASLSGGIHNQGQVWSTSMMQVWDAIGKAKTDKIFWEGLAMTNGGSNQNDAANAVYQASRVCPGLTGDDILAVHTVLTARGYLLPEFSLPVQWASVAATAQEKVIIVDWSTASESENSHFDVERSVYGGANFVAIGRVAAEGNATEANDYTFTDEAPAAGWNTYRIRQTDLNGAVSYSAIVGAAFQSVTGGALAPNPTNGELRLTLANPSTAPFVVSIIDLQGRQIRQLNAVVDGERFSVADLANGVYILRFADGDEVVSKRFVKK